MVSESPLKRAKKSGYSSIGLFKFDREFCGDREIAGADEAGRGCLAGPLVVAAVVFDYSVREPRKFARLMAGLADSKKLSAPARERLYPLITRSASRFSIIISGNRTIDEMGLHNTNLDSLCRSIEVLDPWPEVVLVDGRQQLPDCAVPHRPVTGGDDRSACIAAASVIAKVARDRVMRRLAGFYPEYGFDRHVGYATREHREAISRHGYCGLHRLSFSLKSPVAGYPDQVELE
ncbi:MAG: ribonuclease HII [Thermoleophilia bacterium]|nr:ribonuclease HII [Thermoleophilia bacterium]